MTDTHLPAPVNPTYSADGAWVWDSRPVEQGGQRWWPSGIVTPGSALPMVTLTPCKTNHVLHLILTLVTFGLWLPIWLLVAIRNSFKSDVSRTYQA